MRFRDETRAVAPVTAATVENIEAVRNLIKTNARITTAETQDILGIGPSATNSILRKHLGVQKRSARWVRHDLTDAQ